MDFSMALLELKAGKRIQRPHMLDHHTRKYLKALSPAEEASGKKAEEVSEDIHLESFVHLAAGAMVLHTVDGRELPWHPEHADTLAEDWECTASS